jgi:hypothetical protein
VQPSTGLQCSKQAAEQDVVIQYPVKRSGTENSVKRILKWKGEKISCDKSGVQTEVWGKVLPGMKDHVPRQIETDHASARKILKQQPSEFSAAATCI